SCFAAVVLHGVRVVHGQQVLPGPLRDGARVVAVDLEELLELFLEPVIPRDALPARLEVLAKRVCPLQFAEDEVDLAILLNGAAETVGAARRRAPGDHPFAVAAPGDGIYKAWGVAQGEHEPTVVANRPDANPVVFGRGDADARRVPGDAMNDRGLRLA